MFGWCNVEEMQNSAVSFLMYSFSVSFLRRFRNSYGTSISIEQTIVDESTAVVSLNTAGKHKTKVQTHLDSIELLLSPIPLMGKPYNASRTLPDRYLLTHPIFLRQTGNTIAP
jgi:hypothetical protein